MSTYLDARKNFAISDAVGGSLAEDTEVTVLDASRFPDPSVDGAFNLVWWDYTDYPNSSDDPNREIVRVIAGDSNTFTIIRAQEGTEATDKNLSDRTYKLMLGLTEKTLDDIEDFMASKGAAEGLATLDSDAKIPASALPALAINDTFVVSSQASMLALTAQRGDMAIRTDLGTTFVLSTDDPTNIADWIQLSGSASVTSVNGLTGNITIPVIGSSVVTASTSGNNTVIYTSQLVNTGVVPIELKVGGGTLTPGTEWTYDGVGTITVPNGNPTGIYVLLFSYTGISTGPVAPTGYVFLTDSDGAYLTDSDGSYLIEAQ